MDSQPRQRANVFVLVGCVFNVKSGVGDDWSP